jgi:hypothetical protein
MRNNVRTEWEICLLIRVTPIQVAVELSPRNYANHRIGAGFLQLYAYLAQPKIRLARPLLVIRSVRLHVLPGDIGARCIGRSAQRSDVLSNFFADVSTKALSTFGWRVRTPH